ncbi:hypothetical protein OAR00_00920 [Alphaproteobacteria bacterium]|nr:hypothetical protein [Alphaproteobacteria bacterium]MDC1023095.1 hypothetical protein [Alphaproteobacteria bacterium]
MTPELKHLQKLEVVSLITMPRAGSEFLQSLLDGHPEILVFILNFKFFSEYLPSAQSTSLSNSSINPNDFIYEFIGKEISRLKGIYNKTERLDRLGEQGDQCLDINLKELIKNFLLILDQEKATVRNVFLALYGAYHLTIGRNILKTKIILHHSHVITEDLSFNEYFPESKKICCIRDPRASIKSFVLNCKKNSFYNYHYFAFYDALNVIKDVCSFSKNYNNGNVSRPCLFVRLEDLPRADTLKMVQEYLGITISDEVYVSTWAGLNWRGDNLSGKVFNPKEKWHENRSYNNWKEELSFADKLVLKMSFNQFLTQHMYDNKSHGFFKKTINKLIGFALLIKPLSIEYGFFSLKYILKKIKLKNNRDLILVLGTPYFYCRTRALLFMSILSNL